MRSRIVVAVVLGSLSVVACGGPSNGSTAESVGAGSGPVGASSTTVVPSRPSPAADYTSAVTAETVDNPSFSGLQERILRTTGELGLPGASLLVVHRGELVQQEAWGSYDLDTRVPIASASKWLTAAVVMTLVDEGTVELDAPIANYMNDLAGSGAGAVTMRQLLAFTSGLQPEESVPCAQDPDVDLVTCARELATKGLRHAPGTQFRYDSNHLMVAGAIAEIVSGVPFAELFQQRIAAPLGMTRTFYFQVKDPTRPTVDHPIPAGGAASTLGDYGRFLEMILRNGVAPDGSRVLSAGSIAEMERNQTEGLPIYGSEFRRRTQSPYGLGHWVDWTNPDGSTMVSSSPGKFGFRGWVDWSNELFGVYLVNDTGNDDEPVQSPSGGSWIYSMSAKAVGGSLPAVLYPHRN